MQRERGSKVTSEEGLDVKIFPVLSLLVSGATERINEGRKEPIFDGVRVPCSNQNVLRFYLE